ncbi:Putative HTH-type transcriptional regulator YwnA [Roseibium album]|nr:Putative HTH-type transcriptional regulator YwnA [Roseibium album]
MPTDSRLPRVLHALLHLDQNEDPITSEMIGKMLNTNPSLVRRLMAGLREAGFVSSTKGHGGGWYLEKPLTEISLAEVYEALGSPQLFALGQSGDAPSCLLARSADEATQKALEASRATFQAELAGVMVADLVRPHVETIKKYRQNKEA